MKKQLCALTLVCLLLLLFSGCARKKTEVLIPVSVRIQDGRYISIEYFKFYNGGYDFQYSKDHVLQKITVLGLNEQVTNELSVTADEEGRILSITSAEGFAGYEETFSWSTQGNLLTQTRVDSKGEHTLRREYNTAGQILSATLITPTGDNLIVYEYSEDGKPVSATHYNEETLMCKTEFTCLEDGRLETETLLDAKNQVRATAVYEYLEDGSARVTVTKKAYLVVDYINQGNGATTTVKPDDPASTVKDIVIVYTYDKAGFLLEEFHGEDNKQNMRYEYTYTTIYVDESTASRVFPMADTLPALGILDQLTV